MAIVATDATRQGYLRLGAHYNDIVYFSKPADWKFQTTTPNASIHYIYSAYSTKQEGPLVLDVPAAGGAGIYGQLCDMWDVPLSTIGPGGSRAPRALPRETNPKRWTCWGCRRLLYLKPGEYYLGD